MGWMVGYEESRLVDRHRFPKCIAGIGHAQKKAKSYPKAAGTSKSKQTQLLGLTEQAMPPIISRGNNQNASLVEKLVIPICSQRPESLQLG